MASSGTYGNDLGRVGMEAGRSNAKYMSPVSPTVGLGTTTPPTAAASINPPIGGFAGGQGGLNNATAAGQIQSGQLHTDVSNFHDWYGGLTPEQAKTFAPNTTDPKGANYVNPIAGGNVAPGVRTADNLEGIQKENARQHFMRTLQLGKNQNTTAAGTPALPTNGAATLDNPVIGSAAVPTAKDSITPPIGQNAFDAHKGYQDQIGKLDEAKVAGTSVEGLAAQRVQAQAVQAQQAEAQKAKDQIYNGVEAKTDLAKSQAEKNRAEGAAATTNATNKPGTEAARLASTKQIADDKNKATSDLHEADNKARSDLADKNAKAHLKQEAQKANTAPPTDVEHRMYKEWLHASQMAIDQGQPPPPMPDGLKRFMGGGKSAATTQPANPSASALPKPAKAGMQMQPGQHEAEAQAFIAAAGGDRSKARALAEQHGWQFGTGGTA